MRAQCGIREWKSVIAALKMAMEGDTGLMLKPGLYEQIISQSLAHELSLVSDACKHVEKLDAAEAPQALAEYVAEAVRETLNAMPPKERKPWCR